MKKETINPTKRQHDALKRAYDYFNEVLFFDTLPPCLLTISNTKALGFTAPSRWTQKGVQHTETFHQIALSIGVFKYHSDTVYSTLVHEMVHLWQFEYGTPGKRKYHNKEWAWKMKEVGLIPTTKDGKETGEYVWHYIEEEGRFEDAFQKMPKECLLPFTAFKRKTITGIKKKETAINEKKEEYKSQKRNRRKITYFCSNCNTKVWGKSNLKIICATCNQLFDTLPPKNS